MKKQNIIQTKSFDFAMAIISLYTQLIQEKEFVISRQLLRSGTSIGANIEEALAGFSKKDFLFKMSLSSKEARETRYWLRLLEHSELTDTDLDSYLYEIDQIINILTSIVKTTQENNS